MIVVFIFSCSDASSAIREQFKISDCLKNLFYLVTAREWPCRTTLSHTVNQGEPHRERLVMHEKPHPPHPLRCPKTHSPLHLLTLLCFLVSFCWHTGLPSELACSSPSSLHAGGSILSSPLHSTPLHCCGERAKAGKARRGSRECLQAIREIISAVKESLFQGRVNLLFILAFAARQD